MISDEDAISVRGAASLPTRPPAEIRSGPRWHRPSRAPWICRCSSWWQWHWHGHRSVGTVSAPIQSHLHPSASTRSNGWTLCVCVCVCVWWVSSQGDQINPNKGENIRCIEISSYDLCKRRASMKLKPDFLFIFFRRKTHLGWYFYHNGKLI